MGRRGRAAPPALAPAAVAPESLEAPPFRLPLAICAVELRLQAPLLAAHSFNYLATILRGACEAALLRAWCARGAGPACHGSDLETGGVACRLPDVCRIPALYPPPTAARRPVHAPLVLWIDAHGPCRLEGALILWGRRALAARTLVTSALQDVGRRAIWDGTAALNLECVVKPRFEGALGDWLGPELQRPLPRRVLLEFGAPWQGDEDSVRRLAVETAHDLARREVEDSGACARLGRAGCDDLVAEAQRRAEQAFAGVALMASRVESEERAAAMPVPGLLRPRTGGGFVELSGDLRAVWPWLRLLELCGSPQSSSGPAAVRLWAPPMGGVRADG